MTGPIRLCDVTQLLKETWEYFGTCTSQIKHDDFIFPCASAAAPLVVLVAVKVVAVVAAVKFTTEQATTVQNSSTAVTILFL
jgi:hypothetical protein